MLNYSPTSWWTGYLDYYYGQEKQAYVNGGPTAKWQAAGVSSKFTLSPHHALAVRYEWYDDGAGFRPVTAPKLPCRRLPLHISTGGRRASKCGLNTAVISPTRPFFERGNDGSPLNPGFGNLGTGVHGPYRHQDTFTIGLYRVFSAGNNCKFPFFQPLGGFGFRGVFLCNPIGSIKTFYWQKPLPNPSHR